MLIGPSDDHGDRVFDQRLEGGEPARAGGAVDDPVIAGQSDGHDGGDSKLVPAHDGALFARAQMGVRDDDPRFFRRLGFACLIVALICARLA